MAVSRIAVDCLTKDAMIVKVILLTKLSNGVCPVRSLAQYNNQS